MDISKANIKISIHALREEGDYAPYGRRKKPCNFYPRPPRGGRPESGKLSAKQLKISIHALREEGDSRCSFPKKVYCISIHALREEGDT